MGRKRTLAVPLCRLCSRIDPELAEFAVERRPADPEAARHFGHAASIMADREADDVGLDVLQRAQMPVGAVERYAGRAGDHLFAALRADAGREVGAAAGVARLDRDVREMLGGERTVLALERGAEQHAGELANVAGPAVAHQHG